jgi:RNA polymerase sigma factor (sigma-70 family)
MDGEEFLQRMRSGDHSVFDDLMPQLEMIGRSACRSLGVFDQRFDDVVQEVAIRVFKRWASYEGQSKLNTWLYSIARNCCLDEMQRDARYRAPPASQGDPDAAPALEPADTSQSDFEHRLCVQQVLADIRGVGGIPKHDAGSSQDAQEQHLVGAARALPQVLRSRRMRVCDRGLSHG